MIIITIKITHKQTNKQTGSPIWLVGIIIFAIFLFDICMRSYCYYAVHGEVFTFFSSTFNQIDVVVVAIDIVFLLLPEDGTNR